MQAHTLIIGLHFVVALTLSELSDDMCGGKAHTTETKTA